MWRVWVDCPARTCVLDERDQADASAAAETKRAEGAKAAADLLSKNKVAVELTKMERSASMLKGGEKCRTSRFLNISILAALTLLPIPDFFGESPD